MIKEQFEQLARIYNTLLLINTKGEDTMLMGDCLKALQSFLSQAQEDLKEE